MDPPGTQRVLLRVCWYGAAVLLAAFVLQAATGVAGEAATGFFQDYVYNALLLAGAGFCLWRAAAFREERVAWLVIGAGLVAWTGADVLWTAVYADDASPPYPERVRRALARLLPRRLRHAAAPGPRPGRERSASTSSSTGSSPP